MASDLQDVLLSFSQGIPRVTELLGLVDLQCFLQTVGNGFMPEIGLSFRLSNRQTVTRFGCLLNHFSICRIMSLNQYLVVLHKLLVDR